MDPGIQRNLTPLFNKHADRERSSGHSPPGLGSEAAPGTAGGLGQQIVPVPRPRRDGTRAASSTAGVPLPFRRLRPDRIAEPLPDNQPEAAADDYWEGIMSQVRQAGSGEGHAYSDVPSSQLSEELNAMFDVLDMRALRGGGGGGMGDEATSSRLNPGASRATRAPRVAVAPAAAARPRDSTLQQVYTVPTAERASKAPGSATQESATATAAAAVAAAAAATPIGRPVRRSAEQHAAAALGSAATPMPDSAGKPAASSHSLYWESILVDLDAAPDDVLSGSDARSSEQQQQQQLACGQPTVERSARSAGAAVEEPLAAGRPRSRVTFAAGEELRHVGAASSSAAAAAADAAAAAKRRAPASSRQVAAGAAAPSARPASAAAVFLSPARAGTSAAAALAAVPRGYSAEQQARSSTAHADAKRPRPATVTTSGGTPRRQRVMEPDQPRTVSGSSRGSSHRSQHLQLAIRPQNPLAVVPHMPTARAAQDMEDSATSPGPGPDAAALVPEKLYRPLLQHDMATSPTPPRERFDPSDPTRRLSHLLQSPAALATPTQQHGVTTSSSDAPTAGGSRAASASAAAAAAPTPGSADDVGHIDEGVGARFKALVHLAKGRMDRLGDALSRIRQLTTPGSAQRSNGQSQARPADGSTARCDAAPWPAGPATAQSPLVQRLMHDAGRASDDDDDNNAAASASAAAGNRRQHELDGDFRAWPSAAMSPLVQRLMHEAGTRSASKQGSSNAVRQPSPLAAWRSAARQPDAHASAAVTVDPSPSGRHVKALDVDLDSPASPSDVAAQLARLPVPSLQPLGRPSGAVAAASPFSIRAARAAAAVDGDDGDHTPVPRDHVPAPAYSSSVHPGAAAGSRQAGKGHLPPSDVAEVEGCGESIQALGWARPGSGGRAVPPVTAGVVRKRPGGEAIEVLLDDGWKAPRGGIFGGGGNQAAAVAQGPKYALRRRVQVVSPPKLAGSPAQQQQQQHRYASPGRGAVLAPEPTAAPSAAAAAAAAAAVRGVPIPLEAAGRGRSSSAEHGAGAASGAAARSGGRPAWDMSPPKARATSAPTRERPLTPAAKAPPRAASPQLAPKYDVWLEQVAERAARSAARQEVVLQPAAMRPMPAPSPSMPWFLTHDTQRALAQVTSYPRAQPWQVRDTRKWLFELRLDPAAQAPDAPPPPLLEDPLRNGLLLSSLAAALTGAHVVGVSSCPKHIMAARGNIVAALRHMGFFLPAAATAAAAPGGGAPASSGLQPAPGDAVRGYAAAFQRAARLRSASPQHTFPLDPELLLQGNQDATWSLITFIRMQSSPAPTLSTLQWSPSRAKYAPVPVPQRQQPGGGGAAAIPKPTRAPPPSAASSGQGRLPLRRSTGEGGAAESASLASPSDLTASRDASTADAARLLAPATAAAATAAANSSAAPRPLLPVSKLPPGGRTAARSAVRPSSAAASVGSWGTAVPSVPPSGVPSRRSTDDDPRCPANLPAPTVRGSPPLVQLLHDQQQREQRRPASASAAASHAAAAAVTSPPRAGVCTTDLPYNEEEVLMLEVSLVHWLYNDLRLISSEAAVQGFGAIFPAIADGSLLCAVAARITGTPIPGVFQKMTTNATRVSNINRAVEALRACPKMSRRFLYNEAPLLQGDRLALTGLLEDIHRLADRKPPNPVAMPPDAKPYTPCLDPQYAMVPSPRPLLVTSPHPELPAARGRASREGRPYPPSPPRAQEAAAAVVAVPLMPTRRDAAIGASPPPAVRRRPAVQQAAAAAAAAVVAGGSGGHDAQHQLYIAYGGGGSSQVHAASSGYHYHSQPYNGGYSSPTHYGAGPLLQPVGNLRLVRAGAAK